MKKILLSCMLLFLLSSCDEILEVEDISENLIIVNAPADNSIINEGIINFNWEQIAYATEYKLQIATPNFTNAAQIVMDTIITSNNFSHELEINEYEWRVKALNSSYETGYTIQSFTVN